MPAIVGSIAAELLVDRSKFDQGLGRAGITVRNFQTDTRTRLGMVDRSFASTFARVGTAGPAAFAALARGAALALAPILSVSAALNTAKAALTDFDRIAKNAKASGLDGETFQEFAFAAELGGVNTETFSSALQTFAKNAGLAAEGKGKLVTALKALNPELLRNILATDDQAERLKLAADAIDAAGSASEKAALSTALFGDAGTRMVEVLHGGRNALDETARKARELGMVIDRDLLARAETMNDEFSTATRVMDLNFKRALIDLAPVLIATAQLAGAVARAIGGIADSMKTLENRSSSALEERLIMLQKGGLGNGPGNRSESADNQAAAAEIAQIEAILRQRAINNLREQLTAPPRIVVDGGTVDLEFGTSGRAGAAKAILDQAEAVKKLIADLQFEQDQLSRTAEMQEFYNLLKSAGVSADSDFGRAIAATLFPLQSQRAAIEANKQAMEAFQSLASDTMKGFARDLREGKTFTEALSNALGRLGDRLIDMSLDTAISGLFSGFGGMGGAQTKRRGLLGGMLIPGILHSGGSVGKDGYGHSRALPASTWAGAPRFHSGLGNKEFAAILERGERVLTADQSSRTDRLLTAIGQGATKVGEVGQSVIRVLLEDGLKAEIVNQAVGQSVQISKGMVAPVSRAVDQMANQGRYS